MDVLFTIIGLLIVVPKEMRALRLTYKELNELDDFALRLSNLAHNNISIRLTRVRMEGHLDSRYIAAESERVVEEANQRLNLSLAEMFAVRRAMQRTALLSVLPVIFYVAFITLILNTRFTGLAFSALALDIAAMAVVTASTKSSYKLWKAQIDSVLERFAAPKLNTSEADISELLHTRD